MKNLEHSKSKKDFWQERYKSGSTPWDIGKVAPAFVKYFSRGFLQKAIELKFAVLGCGRGHDAFFIAEGEVSEPRFQVHGFDFAEDAIKSCNKLKQENNLSNINFHQTDFFELIKNKKWEGYFDYVIEHTSFCAIDPELRKEYIDLIKYLLKPKGKLVGLFFIRPKELGGPPFGSTVQEIRESLGNDFTEINKLHHEECPHAFTGKEYFGVFERK